MGTILTGFVICSLLLVASVAYNLVIWFCWNAGEDDDC